MDLIQASRCLGFLDRPKGVLCHLDKLPRSGVEPHERQTRHDSSNRDTECDRDEMARAGLDKGCRQEGNRNQPEVDKLETLTGM